MSTYSRIVVGSDGSEGARDAVAVAGAIAAQLAVSVTAVTAWKSEIAVPGAREAAWAERTTMGAYVDLNAAEVRDVARVEVKGDPAGSLVAIAQEVPDSLIVVGAHGLVSATSRLSGSTSNDLSHNSTADVLFVRNRVARVETVALATDGSETSLLAVRTGYAFAAALQARISLVTVAETVEAGDQLLEEVEEKLLAENSGTSIERRTITGSAADSLVSETVDYDLLVIGNRGMSGIARVLGSTANTITHKAATNLLLVNTSRAL